MRLTILTKNIRVLLVLAAVLSWSSLSLAQEINESAEKLEGLKLDLIEVKAKRLQSSALSGLTKPSSQRISSAHWQAWDQTRPEDSGTAPSRIDHSKD